MRRSGPMFPVTLLVAGLVLAACASGEAGEPVGSSSGSSSGSRPDPETTPSLPSAPVTEPVTGERRCSVLGRIAGLDLRDRLAALVMVGVEPSGTAEATDAVTEHEVGGIFIGGDATGLLTSGRLAELGQASPLGLWVAVDEEGGRVQRIDDLAGSVPSARDQADELDPGGVRSLAAERAEELADLGVNVDLAPVVDVSDQADATVIGDRSYADDPARVTELAGAFADGLADGGVLPVLKHFPGHGRASGDSHTEAVTTPSLAQLRGVDLVPYRTLTSDRRVAVMLGHLTEPGLTGGEPATVSPAAVDLLRDEVGFGGVVMTDDLAAMDAITERYSPAEAAVRALAAGVDMVLFSEADLDALLDTLEAAVAQGRLSEASVNESVLRVLVTRGIDPCATGLEGG